MRSGSSILGFVVAAALLVGACAPAAPASPTAAPAAKPTEASAKPAAGASPAASASPAAFPAASPSPSPGAAPATGPAPAAAAKPSGPLTKMTVSYSNVTPSFLPMWVAKEAGIFEQNGLDVEPQLISGGQVLMASLISGQTPIGTVGGSEVLSAAAAGADLVVLGILVPVSPWQFWTAPDIKSPDQVKGKKLAIVTVGGSADIALRIGLPKLGIDPDKDVTIVATGSTENLNAALLNGAVDGAATHPPDTTVFKAKGFNVLFDLAEQKVASADTAMVTQRSFLNSNRDTVQRYIDSIVQGIAREKTDKPFAVKVLKNYMKLTDDEAASDAYDYYSTRIRPWQPLATPEQFAEAKAALGAKNDKVRDFDVTKVIDNSFIQSAASRGLAGGP